MKYRTISIGVLLLLSYHFSYAQMGISGAGSNVPADSSVLYPPLPQIIDSNSVVISTSEKASSFSNKKKEITPKRIALLSLAAPGIGQIYNKRYWKLPIVYGLIGTGAFFTGRNAKELRVFNTALEERFDSTRTDQFEGIYSTAQLYSFRKYYQRNVEISAILTGFAWGLQIVDAVVDAHLKKFDISDDLSFRIKPSLLIVNNNITPGISFQLGFR